MNGQLLFCNLIYNKGINTFNKKTLDNMTFYFCLTQKIVVGEKTMEKNKDEKAKSEVKEETSEETKEKESTIEKEDIKESKSEKEQKPEKISKKDEKDTEKKTTKKKETDQKEEKDSDFEQMLEDSLINLKKLEVGDKVKGEIINITDSYIFVTLGGKRDAYAEKEDYINKNNKLPYKKGDKLEGYIVKYTDTETVIAKSLITVNLNVLHEAYREKIPVKGKVQSITKGGYIISISGVRAFCPISHIDNNVVVEPKRFLNKEEDFRIIEFKDRGRNIVVSRKVIQKEELKKKRQELLDELEVGSVVKGKVMRLTNFGAFIDLGGIDGLLHISQFSWEHIDSPSEILNLGDEVETKVIKIKGEKISLSMKALQENPLDKALKELEEGDNVKCKVLRNLPFGSFVEIRVGVEGLIPISEMAHGRRISNPSEIVDEGDMVEAQILKVDPIERQISLSLKKLQPNPWDTIEEKISEDDIITGVIENVVKFGTFIRVTDGVTGLLPASKMKIAKLDLDSSNVGEEIKVKVVKIDSIARRISLEPTNMPEISHKKKSGWNKYDDQKSKKAIIREDNPFTDL